MQRIVCFHADGDFGVTTHLRPNDHRSLFNFRQIVFFSYLIYDFDVTTRLREWRVELREGGAVGAGKARAPLAPGRAVECGWGD